MCFYLFIQKENWKKKITKNKDEKNVFSLF